jgi:hypothetical protein
MGELESMTNVDELFENAFSNYNTHFQPLWENIYSQQYNQAELSAKLKEWKAINESMDEHTTGAAYTVKFLEHIANSDGSKFNLNNTSGIDFSSIEKTGQRIMREEFTTAK